jgi:bacterioferritin-associated ferredoxin
MYVCICKGITENQIRDAIRSGLCTRKEISRCLKVGTACGKCDEDVRDLLQRSLAIGNRSLRSLLSEQGSPAFTIPLPGLLSLPESPVDTARLDGAQGIQVVEEVACPA